MVGKFIDEEYANQASAGFGVFFTPSRMLMATMMMVLTFDYIDISSPWSQDGLNVPVGKQKMYRKKKHSEKGVQNTW